MIPEKTYDSIIVLSNQIIPSCEDILKLEKKRVKETRKNRFRRLAPESIQRVEEGVKLYHDGTSEILIMNGGPGQMTNGHFVPREKRPFQCDLMIAYALKRGNVPMDNIKWQSYSADTVGEAFFVKPLLESNNLVDNLIVTSWYHVDRVNEIYKKFWGDDFNFEVKGIPYEFESSEKKQKQLDNESRNLELFFEQFGDIDDGDDEALERRLYKVHGLYNKIPENERLIFYN